MEQYVRLGVVRPLGWAVLVLSAAAAFFAWRAAAHWPALIFVVFGFGGIYLLVGAASKYAVDEAALYALSPLGRSSRMLWSEVSRIEVGNGGTWVFQGGSKQFVLPPPEFWSGEHKRTVHQRLLQCVQRTSIAPVKSNRGDYRLNKNVRVNGAV
jgi:hypothetical protein